MNLRKLVSDLLTAFGAQGVSFACSVIATLFVPKILGVEEFGYWQLFIFYTSYVSFFQLGLNDGIYLQHGGKTRDVIDKGLIKGELQVGILYQAVAALLIAVYGVFFEDDQGRMIVVVASAVYLLLSNTGYYLSYVFQSMNETKLSSLSTVVNRASYLPALCICVLFGVTDFRVYMVFYIFSQALSLVYCFWHARDFMASSSPAFKKAVRETLTSMKVGIILTIANVSGMLIMGIARLIIDAVWGLSAFGQISLSLSIVNFALTFISQAAMVLFPALRVAGVDKARHYYQEIRDGLAVILPFAMLLYAPLRAFVGFWLPEYSESLVYLAFLFPVCLFEVQTNLTVVTFLKVCNEAGALLKINVAALLCALGAQVVAVLVFGSAMAVVIASLLGVAARYVLGTLYLAKAYGSRNGKVMLCMLVEAVLFMLIAYYAPLLPGFGLCVLLVLIHLAVCRSECSAVLSKFKGLKHSKREGC